MWETTYGHGEWSLRPMSRLSKTSTRKSRDSRSTVRQAVSNAMPCPLISRTGMPRPEHS
jgi:hypothetical protein